MGLTLTLTLSSSWSRFLPMKTSFDWRVSPSALG